MQRRLGLMMLLTGNLLAACGMTGPAPAMMAPGVRAAARPAAAVDEVTRISDLLQVDQFQVPIRLVKTVTVHPTPFLNVRAFEAQVSRISKTDTPTYTMRGLFDSRKEALIRLETDHQPDGQAFAAGKASKQVLERLDQAIPHTRGPRYVLNTQLSILGSSFTAIVTKRMPENPDADYAPFLVSGVIGAVPNGIEIRQSRPIAPGDVFPGF